MNYHYIVCCTPYFGDSWQWFAAQLDGGSPQQWLFFNDKPQSAIEKIRKPNLSMVRASLQAVQTAKRLNAKLLITHDPRVTFWCALFANLLQLKTEHIAYSFNFPELPRGLKYHWMKWAFAINVRQFIIYSKMEKQLYSDYFNIPIDRFEVVLWSVGTPTVQPDTPLEAGDYICAIGGNARDYATLMTAMSRLPDIPLVAIVRNNSLTHIDVPPNVRVHVELPTPHAMNILQHSRFMVLPLKGTEVPCGHVTLVAAMHLGKAFVITNSTGVSDYALHDHNSLTCKAFNADALADAIQHLWQDPGKAEQLGANGKHFAQQQCSEASARQHL